MNRIDFKLGASMILLVVIILLPLGYVFNQIFSSFHVQQLQKEAIDLSNQYASIINDDNVENSMSIVEASARIANQQMLILDENVNLLSYVNIDLTQDDIDNIRTLLDTQTDHHYLSSSLEVSNGSTLLASAAAIDTNNASGHIIMFRSLDVLVQSRETAQILILISIVGAMLLGIGLAYFLSRMFTMPLISMEKAARRIAKGEAGVKIPITSNDQLGSLAAAINDLQTDLNRANQQRREFLASVSHELQTPITYLKGYAKVIRNKLWNDEIERDRYLLIIEEESDRLSTLINDLFDLAKMDEGQFRLQIGKVNIAQLIERLVEKAGIRAKQNGNNISFHNKLPNQVTLNGDELRIEQMLLNVIENAIRYTKNGTIDVFLSGQANLIKIEVSDTGIGMEKEHLDQIYERFFRVEKSRSRAYGGSGLGLAITKQLVQLHNGQISIESQRDIGTSVSIMLPNEKKGLSRYEDEEN